jgi:hypothetical protein
MDEPNKFSRLKCVGRNARLYCCLRESLSQQRQVKAKLPEHASCHTHSFRDDANKQTLRGGEVFSQRDQAVGNNEHQSKAGCQGPECRRVLVRSSPVLSSYASTQALDGRSSLSKKRANPGIWQEGQGTKNVLCSDKIMAKIS